jgi:hypothetical protein
MAIDTSKIDLMAGNDEVVMNQRVRAYVPSAQGVGANNGQFGTLWMVGTGIPTSFASGSQTYTAAILGGGLIVHGNAGAVNGTLDTSANILAYMQANSAGVQAGDIMQCQVFNTGSGILTIVPGDANTTFDANGVNTIGIGISKTLNIRCTNVLTPTFKIYM